MFMARKFWLVWVPVLAVAAQWVVEQVVSVDALDWMNSEQGFYELLQFFVMAAALGVAVLTFARMDRGADRLMTAWVGLACVCCLYVAGEEVSWAQHFLEWSTPDYWAHWNDQGETNFHNTTSWLDQKPRLILMIGIGLGGLVFPLLQKYRPGLLPARFAMFYPSSHLWVIAAIVIGVHLVDKLAESAGGNLFHRTSEQQELYMFYFVLVYLLDLYRRLTRAVPNSA